MIEETFARALSFIGPQGNTVDRVATQTGVTAIELVKNVRRLPCATVFDGNLTLTPLRRTNSENCANCPARARNPDDLCIRGHAYVAPGKHGRKGRS